MAAKRKKARFSDFSQNIPKPQCNFADEINNYGPFVPRIKSKPNALFGNPLPKALVDYNSNERDTSHLPTDESLFQHPYMKELKELQFSLELLQKVSPQENTASLDPPCEVITTRKALLSMIQRLRRCEEIAIDLEGHTYRSFQGFTCLLQLSTRVEDFLIDAISLRSQIHLLNEILTDPNVVKVFHGAGQDILWLQRDFGVYVVNLFDTELAARVAGCAKSSLDHLLAEYCGAESEEKAEMQLSDWRVRPIPTKMRKYAQKDTHYLLYLYDILKNKLIDSAESCGNVESKASKLFRVFNESRDICLRKYEKPTTRGFLEKNQGKMKTNQVELLKILCEWRENVARDMDESTGYVMPNSMLLEIVQKMPANISKFFPANRIDKHPLIKRDFQNIQGFLKQARKAGKATAAKKTSVETKEKLNKHIYFSDSDEIQPVKKSKTS